MRRALVLASWGFPGGWKEVSYYGPEGFCKDRHELKYDEGKLRRSTTPLAWVVDLLKKDGLNADVIVFEPDTLGARYREIRDVSSYEGLVDIVKRNIGNFARQHVGDVEVVVVPGTGQFKAEGGFAYFEGFMENAFVAMLGVVYNRLASNDYDMIVADITHGVNYMSAFLRDVAWIAARYVSARRMKGGKNEVCLVVLNSDPVTEGTEGPFRINVVEYAKVKETPPSFVEWIAGEVEGVKLYTSSGVPPPSSVNELDGAYREVSTKANIPVLANALLYGAVLYLYSISSRIREASESAKKLVEKSLQILNSEVEFRREGANVYVKRTYGLYPYHIYLAMAIDILSQILDQTRGEQTSEQTRDAREVSLATLAEFPLRQPAATILSNEIDKIKSALKCLVEYGAISTDVYIPLSYVLRIVEKCCEDSEREDGPCGKLKCSSECIKSLEESLPRECNDDVCNADRRNFVAHAGLERNTVCVKVAQTSGSGVEIYLRYRKSCLDKIPNLLAPKRLSKASLGRR